MFGLKLFLWREAVAFALRLSHVLGFRGLHDWGYGRSIRQLEHRRRTLALGTPTSIRFVTKYVLLGQPPPVAIRSC